MKKMLLVLAAAGLCLGTGACNTVKGFGRDVESVGQAGSDAINN
jgi:predicted small secreted protein